jgi:predicted dehydrogenase
MTSTTPAPAYHARMTGDAGTMTLAVVGAGLRGQTYARLAVATGRCRVVTVADADPARRTAFAREHGLPASAVHSDWTALAAAGRLADAVVIATPDRLHADPAVALLGQGYHVLLEKPMAPTEEDARRIVDAVRAAGDVTFAVCHVLRYTPYTRALRALVRAGRIGRPVSVQHLEPVGWWHQAHSYVRGNWRREDSSGPMLLTKSCHDLDWLIHVVGQPVSRVSSFGGLAHFRPEDRPTGATDRCVTCPVEPGCPYSATRLYLDCVGDPRRERWPLGAVTTDATAEGVLDALRTGPYGRCVYNCDNDVVDHQVVALEFADGATGVFTMTAFTVGGHRQTRIFGTHGCVEGDGIRLRVVNFRDASTETIDTATGPDGSAASGHGGGDQGLIEAFVTAVRTGDRTVVSSDAEQSLTGHLAVWAAERSRRTGTVQSVRATSRG